MTNVVVKITGADYYDSVQIFIDGVPYGKKQGNSIFVIPVTNGEHVIHGVYDNMEPDFKGYCHALDACRFTASGIDVKFEVRIINIFRGGNLIKL